MTTEFDMKIALAAKNRYAGLWRMMTGYRLVYIFATICLGIAAIMKTGTYLLLGYFTDQVMSQTGSSYWLPLVAIGFIVLALIEGGFTYLSGRLAAYTAEGVTRRTRNYLYDHIQRLPFLYFDHTATGELIQRCTSDVDAIRRFFADQAIGVGRIILLFVVNFTALALLSLPLAVFSVIIVPFIVITSVFFFRKVTKAYESYQEQDAVVSTILQENLSGVRVVKAFARQEYETQKFDLQNWEKYRRGKRLLIMHSAFWPLSDILCGFQMLSGFTLAAVMAINGTITVGTYLAYTGLLVWLIFPMRNLGRLVVQASTGLVSYGRVLEIVRQDREPLEQGLFQPQSNVRGEIVFDSVRFEYDAGSPIIEDISFSCQPGQVIALLGTTGAGKTSLVNLLPRFYEYTSGSIKLDGAELNEYPRRYLRAQIGIVEQEPFLFSRTIRENIIYGVDRQVSDSEVIAAAKAAAVHEVILTFPDGYQTLIGEKGVTLSGGQKQRVAIARTLLKDPRILILDDATSSVDTETEAAIRGALEYLMQGRTSFIIAHRIQSVMGADLILVLDKGRIVQRGTHQELLSQEGIYRRVFDIQTRIEADLELEIARADLQLAVD